MEEDEQRLAMSVTQGRNLYIRIVKASNFFFFFFLHRYPIMGVGDFVERTGFGGFYFSLSPPKKFFCTRSRGTCPCPWF